MSAGSPHPNAGSSGTLRTVLQALEAHPQGLTTSQILDFVSAQGQLKTDPREGPKAPYFRVKRAVASLLKLGFVRQGGFSNLGGRAQQTFIVVPQAMDKALRDVLRQALANIGGQIRNQFPLSDATHLVAAFEEVLEVDAERLGLAMRKPKLGPQAFRISKTDPSE